ncbi:MAG: exodeoxyribonuclease VII small subunit [Leptolyngbyaceae cyanobacterium CSU_1_3]|nr:exodeoxyribonuclease VII small subunit [Leptolyngbyaceae cyanobacterium CSU_1_3]
MPNSPRSNAISDQRDRSDTLQDGWNYEATVAEVEEILAQIESGELELADVFDRFSTAMEYLRQCEGFLAQRQKQVDLLIETLTDEQEF